MPGWFAPVFITLVVLMYLGIWPLILWLGCRAIDEHYREK